MIQFTTRHAAFAGPKQRFAEFGFPRPRQTRNAKDFTLTQMQGDIFQQRFIVQSFNPQQRFLAVRRARRRVDIAQLMTKLFSQQFPRR